MEHICGRVMSSVAFTYGMVGRADSCNSYGFVVHYADRDRVECLLCEIGRGNESTRTGVGTIAG